MDHAKSSRSEKAELPAGFRYAAVRAGLKPSGRPDFALIAADHAASAAALYTSNRVQAAPLAIDRRHLERTGGRVRAAAINAGNANCATGEAGLAAAEATCRAVASALGCAPEEVFPSSTGIIGVPLPAEKLTAAVPELVSALVPGREGFDAVAQAILTTDTVAKVAFAQATLAGGPVRVAGLAKGSGMIYPRLAPHATMLAYVLTDAEIEPAELEAVLAPAAELSFNRISVDGDTSTNDTLLLLASGASGVRAGRSEPAFAQAVQAVCESLARQIVSDGEGIGHVVELQIEGAGDDADALRVARSIAHSPLVKTAWAGSDPNWGRLMAAIGSSGAAIDPGRVDIWFGQLPVCRAGGRAEEYDPAAAHRYLGQKEFAIRILLHRGAGSCRFWTTDLTAEYVHINADYST